MSKPEQILISEQDRNAQRLRSMANALKRSQQSGRTRSRQPTLATQPHGDPAMGVFPKDSNIPIIKDDDYYFVANLGGRAPFYLSPEPEYFHDYERACREDEVTIIQQLVSQHSLTPAVRHHGLTLALSAGSEHCVREFLVRETPITNRAAKKILSAPKGKQITLLETLVVEGGWTPSHDLFILTIPDIALMKWFLSHGVNPNYGTTMSGQPSQHRAQALESAAYAGSAQAVELLIDAGAKVDYGTPLHYAAGVAPRGQESRIAKASQEEDFDISRIPAMEALVAHGADVNGKDGLLVNSPGYPIVRAAQVGAVHRVRWLLNHGADPNLKGDDGSAADWADKMGSDEMKEVFRSWQQRSIVSRFVTNVASFLGTIKGLFITPQT